MKKFFSGGLISFSMLLAVTGCSKETTESANDGAVKFQTVLGKQQTVTKVSEFTGNSWQAGDQLIVKSYAENSTSLENFFTLERQVDGTWIYSPAFNQPGYKLRYYSIYPLDNVTDQTAAASAYSFKYTVPTTAASQKDLIGAAPAATSSQSVTLAFNHLLSQVNFAMMNSIGLTATIQNVVVNGVKADGTYTFGSSTPWDVSASTKSNYAYTQIRNVANGATPGIVYMGNGGTVFTENNALMLVPQTFSAETDGTFSFEYRLHYKDDSDQDVYIPGETTWTSVSVNLCDFETTAWLPGKRYVYLIDFSTFLAGGPITFSVSVNSWIDDADNTIAETVIVSQATQGGIESAILKHAESNAANSALKVFPISVSADVEVVNAFTITSIPDIDTQNYKAKFDDGDKIRIEFPTGASLTNVDLSTALQTVWDEEISGRVLILTKKTAVP